MLVQQAALFSTEERIDKIYDRLIKYGMIKQKSKDLKKRIELASNWANDHLLAEEKFEIEMKENYQKAIQELIETLKSFVGLEHEVEAPKNLQSKIFNIARNNQMEPKELFTLLYKMLLNMDRGPRLGNYALDLGIERTCNILERYIQ
jgi:lysyl-tRNA synthetase, class I